MITTTERIVSLQILRFVAATGVISLHVWQVISATNPRGHLGLIGEFGPAGVDLFFVLSGFIITLVSTGKTAGDFLARRFGRILPLYWIVTGAMMLIHAAGGVFDPHRMVQSFLFLPIPGYRSYLMVGWTLCYEVLFYICFAVVLLFPTRGALVAISAYVMASIGRELFGGPVLQFIGNPLIIEFLAGCLIAGLPRSCPAMWLCLLGVTGWAAVIIATGYEAGDRTLPLISDAEWVRVWMWGVPAALLVYSARQVRLVGKVSGALAYLGDASYSAYLVHELVLIFLEVLRPLLPPVVGVPFGIALCWFLAVIVHEGLEKPLLRVFSRPRTRLGQVLAQVQRARGANP